VLDFVLAAHIRALDEPRGRDSEVASAARADGRKVEALLGVFGEDGVYVEHFLVLLFEFYIVNIRKSWGNLNPRIEIFLRFLIHNDAQNFIVNVFDESAVVRNISSFFSPHIVTKKLRIAVLDDTYYASLTEFDSVYSVI
jgi:hypothetical protein